ncbi:MAG: hypothetical protein B7Y56_09090 [Gallionellales bacterium 35-53-114]|jgi:enoyl reductase-like protein|nr:MAG: hypothetical protein B7Y56_09090 [Gallionellales bacterium 35-53-114]OYZ62778.1 MAG: hypothetical protein B7Y04_12945 [Gallionellales bacterium 24-53-125]OZB09854.1 MAG: hypothetical protein B7X61_04845 [Gallionellales bacterium 39-52-133]HQS57581.1 DUF6279 family lipoprotein [Gallionellaceae bacterium]HQS74035.1 DUF6279 family lipoprotein [Gallionellaceae bacterium]
MKRIGIFLVVLLLLPLSGCSVVSIGYNYADAYLRYSINSYATFDDRQTEIIREEVDVFMRWHRRVMLPQYVSFLQEVRLVALSGKALMHEDVGRLRVAARKLYVKTLQPTVSPAASLLSGINAAQIDELVHSFAKENNRQRDKVLTGNPHEQLRKRAERTIDFIESLVGGLTDEQQEKIREQSHRLPFATALYLRLREENQAGLVGMLKENKSEEEIAALLSAWLTTPEFSRSPDEQELLMSFELATDEMIVNVYAMLNERQKKTLLINISKYIDSFTQLASGT